MPIVPDVGLDAVHAGPDGQVLFSIEREVFAEGLGRMLAPGDVLSDAGTVDRTNADLMALFHPEVPILDHGLDALFVWPDGEIWFSTEVGFLDAEFGPVGPGDLLSDRGVVVFATETSWERSSLPKTSTILARTPCSSLRILRRARDRTASSSPSGAPKASAWNGTGRGGSSAWNAAIRPAARSSLLRPFFPQHSGPILSPSQPLPPSTACASGDRPSWAWDPATRRRSQAGTPVGNMARPVGAGNVTQPSRP